jgi:hypothetical protein
MAVAHEQHTIIAVNDGALRAERESSPQPPERRQQPDQAPDLKRSRSSTFLPNGGVALRAVPAAAGRYVAPSPAPKASFSEGSLVPGRCSFLADVIIYPSDLW